MRKEIETILTADATQQRSEYAKAAKAVEDYEKSITAGQQRARQRAAEELKALQLEARGRADLAASIRQQIKVADEARTLAGTLGITEAAAVEAVRYRLQLEEQIVERKRQAAAEAAKQAAFERQLSTAAGARQAELEAMAATREKIRKNIEDSAAAQAREAAAQAQARERRIQALPSRGSAGLPELALTPQMIAMQEKANLLLKEKRKGLLQVGSAGKSAGLGILYVSQGIEDLQYGIRGVLNNIPQTVMAFGGSAGLAGAISLAAVGLVTYQQQVDRLLGTDKLDKRLKAEAAAWEQYAAAIERSITEFKDRKLKLEIEVEGEERLRKEQAQLQKLITIDKQRFDQLRDQEQQLSEMRRHESEKLRAQERYSLERSPTEQGDLGVRRLAVDLTAGQTDKAFVEDIAATQAKLNEAARQYQRIWDGIGEKFTQYQMEIGEAENGLSELQARVERYEAERSRLLSVGKELSGSAASLNERNLQVVEKELAAAQRLMAERERAAEQARSLYAQTESQGRENLRTLDEEMKAHRAKIESLNEERKLQQYLAGSERAMIDLRKKQLDEEQQKKRGEFAREVAILEARAAGNQKLADSLERQRAIEEVKLRLMQEQGMAAKAATAAAERRVDLERKAADAEKDRAKHVARRDFGIELQALRLEAGGRKDMADALRRELEIRQSAAGLAESLGVSERQALAMARERQALEERIAEAKKQGDEPRRRAIYKLSAEESAQRQRERNVSTFRGGGIRNATLERMGRNQRRPDNAAALNSQASNYYERSLSAQEALVTILKGVGLA